MDKLSLYDFLSFLVPGFIAFEWAKFIYVAADLPVMPLLNDYTDVELGLTVMCVSFFTGLIIHRVTFWAISQKQYGFLLYQPVGPIIKESTSLKPALSLLEELCIEKCGQPLLSENDELTAGFFDEAYFTLEGTDKINSIKGFQSIYFFLRNLFTLGLIAIPVMVIEQALLWIDDRVSTAIWLALPVAIAVALLCVPLARFSRRKMIERLFWTYCTLQSHTSSKL